MFYTFTEMQKLKVGHIIKLPKKIKKDITLLGLIPWKKKVTIEEEHEVFMAFFNRRTGLITIGIRNLIDKTEEEIEVDPSEKVKYRVYETIKNI